MNEFIRMLRPYIPKSNVQNRLVNCLLAENICSIEHAIHWLTSGEARRAPNMGKASLAALKAALHKIAPEAIAAIDTIDVPSATFTETRFLCGIKSHRHTNKQAAIFCIQRRENP